MSQPWQHVCEAFSRQNMGFPDTMNSLYYRWQARHHCTQEFYLPSGLQASESKDYVFLDHVPSTKHHAEHIEGNQSIYWIRDWFNKWVMNGIFSGWCLRRRKYLLRSRVEGWLYSVWISMLFAFHPSRMDCCEVSLGSRPGLPQELCSALFRPTSLQSHTGSESRELWGQAYWFMLGM